jgi:farnesyl diphosphate synthase
MVGGQMIDMDAANHALGAAEVVLLQRMKTGALFEFCCEGGAILAGAQAADRERLRDYARDFGLLFQVTDDLLDVIGTREETGKTVGKDQRQGKASLVSILGIDGARTEAAKLAASAAGRLDNFGDRAEVLRELPFFVLDRGS